MGSSNIMTTEVSRFHGFLSFVFVCWLASFHEPMSYWAIVIWLQAWVPARLVAVHLGRQHERRSDFFFIRHQCCGGDSHQCWYSLGRLPTGYPKVGLRLGHGGASYDRCMRNAEWAWFHGMPQSWFIWERDHRVLTTLPCLFPIMNSIPWPCEPFLCDKNFLDNMCIVECTVHFRRVCVIYWHMFVQTTMPFFLPSVTVSKPDIDCNKGTAWGSIIIIIIIIIIRCCRRVPGCHFWSCSVLSWCPWWVWHLGPGLDRHPPRTRVRVTCWRENYCLFSAGMSGQRKQTNTQRHIYYSYIYYIYIYLIFIYVYTCVYL